MTTAKAYAALADRHGYGQSDRYRRIMEFLMTPLQARLAVSLPKPNDELAAQEGVPLAQVVEELEDLYQKGVVFPRNFETREYFRFARSVMQLHDASESLDGVKVWSQPERKEIWTL